MDDTILKSFLDDFSNCYELEKEDEDLLFENFVNYCIVSKLYPREFLIEDLSTGGGDDLGIDGAAVIINGNIITDEEEIDYFVQQNGVLDVVFVFIQSKNSSKFKGEQVGTFLYGIKSLFDEAPSALENDKIQKIRAIKNKIYAKSINLERLPELKLYFVTAGEWKSPENIVGRAGRELKDIEAKKIFIRTPSIEFIDAEKLKSSYRELKRKIVKEITIASCIAIPDFSERNRVNQALLGCVSVKSYLSLVETDDGKLSKGLFYDNVRDFQGINSVNKEIDKTLKDPDDQNLLSLLNNGITIIAKKVERIGTKIKLSDFQIVNGCQTTNILYENRGVISDGTNIVIKIIETEDKEVTDKIIRATNRQTEVKEEAFESIKTFHRDLQEFYKAKATEILPAIYYERRSKEFVGDSKVKPTQIITLASQVKAYISTVLVQPQSTHRYFGELLNANRERIFTTGTDFNDYYYSALLVNRIYMCFKRELIKKLHLSYRYHIALIVYKKTMKMISKNFSYTDLLRKTNDKEWLSKVIVDSANFIETILSDNKKQFSPHKAVRSKEFTNLILNKMDNCDVLKDACQYVTQGFSLV